MNNLMNGRIAFYKNKYNQAYGKPSLKPKLLHHFSIINLNTAT